VAWTNRDPFGVFLGGIKTPLLVVEVEDEEVGALQISKDEKCLVLGK
jgi:hypothetical protein